MAKFQIQPIVLDGDVITARLGSAAGSAFFFTDADVGKAVKLAAESRFQLCAAGDAIEGLVSSINGGGPLDNFTVGGVQKKGFVAVTFDGLQATPGTGAVAVGDFVVCGTIAALGTSLASAPLKVCKATVQLGAVPADLTAAGAQVKASLFAWRVVSLGSAGTGAVGTTGVMERICA